jgi:hypothetical protein
MGRPSLVQLGPKTPIGRRSSRNVDVPTASPDSSEASSVLYPRRHPRIGTAFQHKLRDDDDLTLLDRPDPIPMSRDIPYRTEQQVQRDTVEDQGELRLPRTFRSERRRGFPTVRVVASRRNPSACQPFARGWNTRISYGLSTKNRTI